MLTPPCRRLQADLVPETGDIEVRGHVPDPILREAVERRIERAVDASLQAMVPANTGFRAKRAYLVIETRPR